MDAIISSALEAICVQGQTGLSLASLWTELGNLNDNSLTPSFKASIYSNLLKIPSLQFLSSQNDAFDPNDAAIQLLEDAEKLGVKIVASLQLRDNFVGLYDTSAANSNLSAPQRRTLERLAVARSNGLTQNQLAKEFGIEGNNLFYIVRNLECNGLIVRQPAVVRTREAGSEGEPKNSSCVTTNLMYLYRYAKQLGSQQRFEISKEGPIVDNFGNGNENAVGKDGFPGESVKEDVHIKDFVPAMKDICDKLEEANGKVLVVSDIKQGLGYFGPSKHKAWRTVRFSLSFLLFLFGGKYIRRRMCSQICRRLTDAGIVKEFDAKVNEKVVRCLRLLKKFSSKKFEPNNLGCGDNFEKEEAKFGRRFPNNEQLVELPIEQQIYDMVDAEGSNGLTVMEVCDRLGLDKKKNYARLRSMFSRFGMPLQPENHKRTLAYRVWAPGNSNSNSFNAFHSKLKKNNSKNEVSHIDISHLDDASHGPDQTFLEYNHSTSKGDFANPGEEKDIETNTEIPSGSFGDDKTNHMLPCPEQELVHDPSDTAPGGELVLVHSEIETNVSPSETKHPALRKALTNPSPSLTPNSLRREKWILERLQVFDIITPTLNTYTRKRLVSSFSCLILLILNHCSIVHFQDEKFILRVELHRWLMNLEDKGPTIDRKTIERILLNLQRQGHCKCLDISVPAVTNCGRTRTTRVVLHPSVQSLAPDLLSEIHDRLRSFEMQIRGRGLSKIKNNELVPVLDGVQRTHGRIYSDDKAVKYEAMRANGFVLAKMVRAKLLHSYLWSFLSKQPGWDDTLSSGKHVTDLKLPHSSCNLFSLEAAIKNIPIELFLQVAGSTQKFDDLIEKCKKGLCLSDLSIKEYRGLMDTRATGRLSLIIDILRRLKLIRLVNNGHSDDGIKFLHANLTHSMELKPYIEEPPSIAATSNVMLLDLRPRIRHDFFLSTKEAVYEYWQTLEYCYAAADPRAARHAFPGSAVHEVFHYRSWASVRVMTADQRAELLKCMVRDNVNEKISYKECEKIAKDLNLTLEQVLRVHSDKRQQRLSRFQGAFGANGKACRPLKNKCSSSQKRKRSLDERSLKRTRVGAATGQLASQGVATLLDTTNKFVEDHDHHFPGHEEGDHLINVEDPGPDEDGESHFSYSQHTSSEMKPSHQKRFSWTDEADRQLVIQYVRRRATLGSKVHRVDWASLPNLPASPGACEKRMSSLRRNGKFRKAIMKLCNLLSERYVKHLEKTQNMKLNNNDSRVPVQVLSRKGHKLNVSDGVEDTEDTILEEKQWDDFNDKNIQAALGGVLRLKRIAKLETSKRIGSASEEYLNNLEESGLVSSATYSDQNLGMGPHKDAARRTKCHLLHQKFLKLLTEGISISREVESLAVSNAIELFKLVFLSTSAAPELPNLLAETLRRYSEHDLFAAFSYLKEKKFMIGGNGSPFVLSQLFLQNLSKSPFPINTGKRATEFSSWLYERGKDLMEGGINLNADLQCGDIFHLLSLVSSGELSISPFLPDEGIGEAEDLRCLKRKNEENEFCDGDKAKKLKFVAESELVSRREKGFPGIMVSVHRTRILMADAVELSEGVETCSSELHDNAEFNNLLDQKNIGSPCQSDHVKQRLNFGSAVTIAGGSSESPWDSMATYAEYLSRTDQTPVSFFSPKVFKTVYAAIQKAGDQGLSIKEVSHVIDMPGEKIPECIINVLQAFGRAYKVNGYDTVSGYDTVRVVDALYRSKYFLISMAGFHQDLNTPSSTKFSSRTNNSQLVQPENHDSDGANSQGKIEMNVGDMHKVTILNLPEDFAEHVNETQTNNVHEVCMQVDGLSREYIQSESYKYTSAEFCMPILPWVNGDGTVNSIVYNGLLHRVLGMVMQNPGISEDEIIRGMDVLNPQSCKKLLELMVLDKHLIVRKMHQTTHTGPPPLLGTLLGRSFRSSTMLYCKHFFANPMSTSLL
ncbi:hypothetical protein Pint_29068 [Pistacia integerrima]|uniref:Uncharacterized protein n=1 Tax=Pistacia integerrima TaxID=434235 RepID=A0ACC0X049_9ROSI|nr:hypothetical protein Pint_29068 [Pistacia integerrima]